MTKPPEVAAVHREICREANCPHLSTLNFADPCASCPEGHWGQYDCDEQAETLTGLGDVVAAVAEPVATAVDKVFGTKLKGCIGCKKRREKLNRQFPL